MQYVLYVSAGLIGGTLGGMGMGGGTALIPLLTFFCGVSQHSAQAINLISFIPMAVLSLIVHLKNKLVIFKDFFYIAISGIFSCVLGCYIARLISGDLLKKIFGGFLILLAIFQFVTNLIKKDK